MRIVTYLIEYLGKFEFIFETILDNKSGDQMGSFDKKSHRKSHAWAPLRQFLILTFKSFACHVHCQASGLELTVIRIAGNS
jgi:hypothetical protein